MGRWHLYLSTEPGFVIQGRPQLAGAAPHARRSSRTRTQQSTPTREQGGNTAWRVLSWYWSLQDDGFLAKSHIQILPASAGRAGRADQINRHAAPSRVQRAHTHRGPLPGERDASKSERHVSTMQAKRVEL